MSNLPKQDDDGMAFVSHSQMNKFRMCPKAYEFRYVEGIPSIMPGKVMLGSAFDKAANVMNEAKMNKSKDNALDVAVDAMEKYMDDPGEDFDCTDIAEDDRVKDKMIEAANEYADGYLQTANPVSVQHEINYKIKDDVTLTGYIDLVELCYNSDSPLPGQLMVTDIKTTRKKTSGKYTFSKAAIDDQLGVYALGLDMQDLSLPVAARGWVVADVGRKTPGRIESVHVVDHNQERTDKTTTNNILSTVSQMEAACETGLFPPYGRLSTWLCSEKFCGYYSRCEYGLSARTTTPFGNI
jgi:hypothetical protein